MEEDEEDGGGVEGGGVAVVKADGGLGTGESRRRDSPGPLKSETAQSSCPRPLSPPTFHPPPRHPPPR